MCLNCSSIQSWGSDSKATRCHEIVAKYPIRSFCRQGSLRINKGLTLLISNIRGPLWDCRKDEQLKPDPFAMIFVILPWTCQVTSIHNNQYYHFHTLFRWAKVKWYQQRGVLISSQIREAGWLEVQLAHSLHKFELGIGMVGYTCCKGPRLQSQHTF